MATGKRTPIRVIIRVVISPSSSHHSWVPKQCCHIATRCFWLKKNKQIQNNNKLNRLLFSTFTMHFETLHSFLTSWWNTPSLLKIPCTTCIVNWNNAPSFFCRSHTFDPPNPFALTLHRLPMQLHNFNSHLLTIFIFLLQMLVTPKLCQCLVCMSITCSPVFLV